MRNDGKVLSYSERESAIYDCLGAIVSVSTVAVSKKQFDQVIHDSFTLSKYSIVTLSITSTGGSIVTVAFSGWTCTNAFGE